MIPALDGAAAATPSRRKRAVLGVAGLVSVAVLAVLAVSCGSKDGEATAGGLLPITFTRPAEGVPFDRVFSWKPVNNATAYHLVVYTADGARAFEMRNLTTAGVKVSDGVRMIPGRYFAEVTAFRDGKEIAKSAMTPFDMK